MTLASEGEGTERQALLLVEDPAIAAELCEPLRAHGYVPHLARAPLDALVALARVRPPRIAITAGPWRDHDAAAACEWLTSELPAVTTLQLDPADDQIVAQLGVALAGLEPPPAPSRTRPVRRARYTPRRR